MLFGHQDDAAKTDSTTTNQSPADDTSMSMSSAPVDQPQQNPLAVDPDTGVSLPVAPDSLEHDHEQHQPYHVEASDTPETATVPGPAEIDESPVVGVAPTDDTTGDDTDDEQSDDTLLTPPTAADDLLALKQQALQQLSPLVDHLDQTPEEKFRTTMMMIQSTDNQGLIKDAYTAAQAIPDDKARAQALLDVVNEINYFTHPHDEA